MYGALTFAAAPLCPTIVPSAVRLPQVGGLKKNGFVSFSSNRVNGIWGRFRKSELIRRTMPSSLLVVSMNDPPRAVAFTPRGPRSTAPNA